MGTEIEFEHGGVGMAYEKEDEEGGEWEQEVEKGGEVELEQLRIQKSFGRWANIKAGHIVVPVGLNNAYHEPLNFFTVYRPKARILFFQALGIKLVLVFGVRQRVGDMNCNS